MKALVLSSLSGPEALAIRDVAEPMPKTGQTRNRLNAWLEPVEDQVTISMELDSTEMLKRFAMAELGVAFVDLYQNDRELLEGLAVKALLEGG